MTSSVTGREGPTSERDSRKRDKAYLDDLAVEVARLFYEQGLSAEAIYADLARRRYDVRSARDVRLLLERARPLISVRVTRADTPVQTNELLAEELVRNTSLRSAIVAKCNGLATDADLFLSDRPEDQERAAREGDDLHRCLGVVAADYLWRIIGDGDRIGVGPGRGTGFTVDALVKLASHRPRRFKKKLHVLSLTGGIVRQSLSPRERTSSLDSDQLTQRLAEALQAEVSFVELPLFLEPQRVGLTKDDIVAATWARYLLEGDPARPPTVALFGINTLNERHYLLQRRDTAQLRPETRIIEPELDRLREVLPQCPQAVLDVCVRFIVGVVNESCRKSAEEIVEGLNSKVVSIAFAKLDKAEQKIVVAGGADKYPAILSLLTDPLEIHATTLVTDDATAGRLVREIPGY